MGDTEQFESAIESFLVDALAASLTRRMADRIVADVHRNRAGRPLPSDVEGLLALVRDELAPAMFLRVGARAAGVLVQVEDRVVGLSAMPVEAWQGPRPRVVYVGRCPDAAAHVGREVRASDVIRIDELFQLFMALDTEERTLVVVDEGDSPIELALFARLVPDFASHVLTFVASTSPATREAFLSSGAAFRAVLRHEPMDHPDVPKLMRDQFAGVAQVGARRPRGDTSTTTEPARAA